MRENMIVFYRATQSNSQLFYRLPTITPVKMLLIMLAIFNVNKFNILGDAKTYRPSQKY